MPIKIPHNLPAYNVLKSEGVMVMDPQQAARQDIRPLKIALINLMPKKVQTENQFSRLIGATPLQIDFSLIRMSGHQSRNTTAEHLKEFYYTFDDIKHEKFDGIIITGAPIEHLDFDDVTYWRELRTIFDWTQTNVHSTFGVCWGAMAMIQHFHNIKKHMLESKAFGCFKQRNLAPSSPYLRGFSDECVIPVSRWTNIKQDDVDKNNDLKTLLGSEETGPCLIEDTSNRVYIFNHFEYDSGTLKEEYDRDIAAGTPINIPCNYYPNDDPSQQPTNRWRSHAHLLYGNWINQIYQTTPFDLNDIGTR